MIPFNSLNTTTRASLKQDTFAAMQARGNAHAQQVAAAEAAARAQSPFVYAQVSQIQTDPQRDAQIRRAQALATAADQARAMYNRYYPTPAPAKAPPPNIYTSQPRPVQPLNLPTPEQYPVVGTKHVSIDTLIRQGRLAEATAVAKEYYPDNPGFAQAQVAKVDDAARATREIDDLIRQGRYGEADAKARTYPEPYRQSALNKISNAASRQLLSRSNTSLMGVLDLSNAVALVKLAEARQGLGMNNWALVSTIPAFAGHAAYSASEARDNAAMKARIAQMRAADEKAKLAALDAAGKAIAKQFDYSGFKKPAAKPKVYITSDYEKYGVRTTPRPQPTPKVVYTTSDYEKYGVRTTPRTLAPKTTYTTSDYVGRAGISPLMGIGDLNQLPWYLQRTPVYDYRKTLSINDPMTAEEMQVPAYLQATANVIQAETRRAAMPQIRPQAMPEYDIYSSAYNRTQRRRQLEADEQAARERAAKYEEIRKQGLLADAQRRAQAVAPYSLLQKQTVTKAPVAAPAAQAYRNLVSKNWFSTPSTASLKGIEEDKQDNPWALVKLVALLGVAYITLARD